MTDDGCEIAGCCYGNVETVNRMVKVVVATWEEEVVVNGVIVVVLTVNLSMCSCCCSWKEKHYEDYHSCNDLLLDIVVDSHETSTVTRLLPLLMPLILWYCSVYCCCSSLLLSVVFLGCDDREIDSWISKYGEANQVLEVVAVEVSVLVFWR